MASGSLGALAFEDRSTWEVGTLDGSTLDCPWEMARCSSITSRRSF